MLTLKENFEISKAELPATTDRERALYETHFALLQEWNQKINLVARKSIEFAFANHYADSLFISEIARPYVKGRVHDLGTGAGFPGVIFAIRYPDVSVTLYEKLEKKQKFLSAVLETLKLPNLSLERFFPDKPVSGLCLARAVFPRDELLPFMAKHLTDDSILVTNLGSQSVGLPLPRGFLKLEEKEYSLPLDQGSRRVEILRKVPRGTF